MSTITEAYNPKYSLPGAGIEGFELLAELALDLRWSWNHSADDVFGELDPVLWELTHNPWVVLQTVSGDRVRNAFADPDFRDKVDGLIKDRREAAETPAWFQLTHSGSPLTSVAYFSMEFMLSEALPIYSGGLGNVAGDQLKAASDLGVPVTGISLLYQQGYFRQMIDQDGSQVALFPFNDPGQLPITPVRESNGEWLRLEIRLPGYSVWLRAWQVQVGRVKLYLLDTNDPANVPVHRCLTGELYGGGNQMRIKQEIILGIGGWRLIRALGLRPEVCHLNEGHAAFAVLERARSFMEDTGQNFEVALAATRPGNLFTTHTPVEAGFDRFEPSLVQQHLGTYASQKLGISMRDLMALGRRNPEDESEPFNMAYLATRGSGAVNGVSRLHGQVSRHIFQPLFPRWPNREVPVGHVTNGVHTPTWDSSPADALWTQVCGKERWVGTLESVPDQIRTVSDADIWELRTGSRKVLVDFIRGRLLHQRAAAGGRGSELDEAATIFDPNTLTLGFARRFAAYKRPTLLLKDPERLLRILNNAERPVQLVIAGKAHPADDVGQELIRQWSRFISRPDARNRVVFLSDYDMLLTARLVQGVDVWLNTPRRPWEASGTSGMKILVNGGLNVSELDGWWAEAYSPEVGWALGDGREHGEDPAWDASEADALYTLLEQEVAPKFYSRDEDGIPSAWVAMMRESMCQLTAHFSANRSVREYLEDHYLSAAEKYKARAEDNGDPARRLVEWQRTLGQNWGKLRFDTVDVSTVDGRHSFTVRLYLGEVAPDEVRVELYADPLNDGEPERYPMTVSAQAAGALGAHVYNGLTPAARPPTDYTPRVIPDREGVAVPLEANEILWQR